MDMRSEPYSEMNRMVSEWLQDNCAFGVELEIDERVR